MPPLQDGGKKEQEGQELLSSLEPDQGTAPAAPPKGCDVQGVDGIEGAGKALQRADPRKALPGLPQKKGEELPRTGGQKPRRGKDRKAGPLKGRKKGLLLGFRNPVKLPLGEPGALFAAPPPRKEGQEHKAEGRGEVLRQYLRDLPPPGVEGKVCPGAEKAKKERAQVPGGKVQQGRHKEVPPIKDKSPQSGISSLLP